MKLSKHFNGWNYSTALNFFYILYFFYLSFMSLHVILVTLTFSRVCKSLQLTVLVMFFFSKQLIPMNVYCCFNYGKVNIFLQLWAA